MAKPALGRGLGNLLGDTQIADKPEPASANPDAAQTAVSPGLGHLLTAGRNGGGEKAAAVAPEGEQGNPAAAAAETKLHAARASVTPKPSTQGAQPPPSAQPEQTEELPVQAPRWVLWAADLLLITLAVMLVFKSPAPLKPWEMTLCLAAVMLGAVLACVAALSKPRR
ncbi:hypothetical protein NXS98_06830 [Fontisphaera persica]|uniref:hypothetical protein n=1 Tax=Fontisphaera persica TaxID=2974023 RepID=UPI0024BF3F26|nr:hypothetical protein [Fontisphaera persica]WCJ60838.1 hypothetical protein NXS98_06830 [Fontisphaera persica]